MACRLSSPPALGEGSGGFLLNQTKRRRLEVQPLQDIFIVKTIDHHTRFQQDTVVLVSPETDIKITAKLITDDTHWLSREDIDRLHEAFKRRIPLEVSLLVRRDPDTGEITNAEIIAIGDMLDTATA